MPGYKGTVKISKMPKKLSQKGLNFKIVIIMGFVVFFLAFSLIPAGRGVTKEIKINKGTSLPLLADTLKREGIIRSRTTFILLALLTGKAGKLQAGWYELSPSFTPLRILNILAEGKSIKVRVTIPEGFTIRDIGRRLEEAGLVNAFEFVSLATNAPISLRAIVGAPSGNLEGFLFPDTYIFPKGLDKEQLLQAMLENFRRKVLDKVRENGVLSFYDTLKLASLVEGEAKHDEERNLIAGVLLNRLEKGMKLECDATVQYILPQHKEMITYNDLAIDSPYNTYKVKGLPPTPICNPGMASIEAALSPQRTPYLFYVARPDGYHIFSKSYREHLRAVERARKLWQKEKE